jgi:hypothetical protein
MSEIKVKRSTIAVILLVAVILGVIVYEVYYAKPPTVAVKYTTGLTVKFKVYNSATYSLIVATTVAEFYAAGVDPMGTRTFTTKPIAVASYDTVLACWTVPLDAGTYVAFVRDSAGSKTWYPEKYTVTVTGTNNEDKEVWLTPSQINVCKRATPALSKAILAYNATTGAYTITASVIDYGDYDKWLVTYTISVSDADTSAIIKAGRFYMTKISGLIPTTVSLDGTEATVVDDTEGSDDGITGYYVAFSQFTVGEVHRIDVYFEDVGATAGTLTGTLFEYYALLRTGTVLRWWSPVTIATTVQA